MRDEQRSTKWWQRAPDTPTSRRALRSATGWAPNLKPPSPGSTPRSVSARARLRIFAASALWMLPAESVAVPRGCQRPQLPARCAPAFGVALLQGATSASGGESFGMREQQRSSADESRAAPLASMRRSRHSARDRNRTALPDAAEARRTRLTRYKDSGGRSLESDLWVLARARRSLVACDRCET